MGKILSIVTSIRLSISSILVHSLIKMLRGKKKKQISKAKEIEAILIYKGIPRRLAVVKA